MIDLKFLRENPEVVKENIKKKFQDHKLPLVDEVIELDAKARAAQSEADELRASRNTLSKQIGQLMGQGKKEEAEAVKAQVSANAARLAELEETEKELQEKVTKIMMVIPNIIDPSVPIGKDDSENVEIKRYGEPVVQLLTDIGNFGRIKLLHCVRADELLGFTLHIADDGNIGAGVAVFHGLAVLVECLRFD